MENLLSTEVVLALIASVGGGIAWIVKYILNKRDENQKRVFAERDRDKQAIKDDIASLKNEVKETRNELKDFQAMIVGCEHPDCPNRMKMRDYLLDKKGV